MIEVCLVLTNVRIKMLSRKKKSARTLEKYDLISGIVLDITLLIYCVVASHEQTLDVLWMSVHRSAENNGSIESKPIQTTFLSEKEIRQLSQAGLQSLPDADSQTEYMTTKDVRLLFSTISNHGLVMFDP